MPTPQKQERVAALRRSVADATGIYLCDFSGINVATMSDLRSEVIAAGGRIEVVKNRLLKLAVAGTPGESLTEYLEGPTAAAFCSGDAIAPARVMKEFAKRLTGEGQRWNIKAALIDGRLFSGARAAALADLPPVQEIKGALVGAIAGPANAMVHTLNGVLSELVFTLQAVADKRGG